MKTEIKILKLGDMMFNRQGTFIRRLFHGVVSLSLRLFFRRIETVNSENVPYKGALIFVMNHPNGLIDPALVFVALPRKISFLAKSTLFRVPVLSYMLQVVEALPVYRKIDSADVEENSKTFEASHELLRRGGAIALFPEGVSHNSPKMLPMKTGAARIALGALSIADRAEAVDLKIVPVGLYYSSKTTFRSEALLHFGKPFIVEAVAPSDGEVPRESVRALTEQIENSLREVTLNAETDAAIETADQAANIFLSVSESVDLEESIASKFEFLRKYIDLKNSDESAQVDAARITRRISGYKKKLRIIGLEPENLSLSNQPFWYVFQHFLLRVLILLIVSPLALIGIILHFPTYQLSKFIASKYTNHGVDDIISTVKIISGIILMPVTWLIISGMLYYFKGWEIGLLSIPTMFLCGYVALRSLEEAAELRGWFRAIRLFYLKRTLFAELLRERRSLHNELIGLNRKIDNTESMQNPVETYGEFKEGS